MRPIRVRTRKFYSVSDTLDLIRGRHNIRFGGTFRANQMNVRNNALQDGFVVENAALTGDDAADLLLGSTGVYAAHDLIVTGGTTGRRWKLFRPFVQDDWRITNSLIVNLGVAWALATPTVEVQNRQSNFDIQTLKWYVPKGSPTLASCTICVPTDGRVGIQFDKTAIEPRIGLSWKVMGSDKTVIRAGYGILHDSSWNQGGQGLWQNPPYYAEVDPCPSDFCLGYNSAFGSLSGGFLVDPTTPSSTPVTGGAVLSGPVNPAAYTGTIQSMNRNFRQGMVQQFNLNVRSPASRKCRFDRRLCWYPQHAYSCRSVKREFEFAQRMWCGRGLHRRLRLPILSLRCAVPAGRREQQRGNSPRPNSPD